MNSPPVRRLYSNPLGVAIVQFVVFDSWSVTFFVFVPKHHHPLLARVGGGVGKTPYMITLTNITLHPGNQGVVRRVGGDGGGGVYDYFMF